MASFLKKLKKLKVDPLAQWASSSGQRKYDKKVGAINALNAADRAAVDVRNKATMEQYGRETDYRGALIESQRGGLASTIMNLGGAAGDPTKPYASQLVGTQAAAAAPELEGYAAGRAIPKKKKAWYDTAPTFGSNETAGAAVFGPGSQGMGSAYDKARR